MIKNSKHKLKVAIIGSGLQANRRAPVITASGKSELIFVSSSNTIEGMQLSQKYGCKFESNWNKVIDNPDLDVVIIATPPNSHFEIIMKCIEQGKHILCEKPISRTIEEAEIIFKEVSKSEIVFKSGFNHRYHPAIKKAYDIFSQGLIGNAIFSRGVYGICGRQDYHKEWRANPLIAAGGQLIEQGTHLIDLAHWFLGSFSEVVSMTSNGYFKSQTMEDNGFALFRMRNEAIFSIHTSLTQWINTFNFEIYGSEGYLKVSGLGGGYGEQTLTIGNRDFVNPFEENITHFRSSDKSWEHEWIEFENAILNDIKFNGTCYDGLVSMRAATSAYKSEIEKRYIDIKE